MNRTVVWFFWVQEDDCVRTPSRHVRHDGVVYFQRSADPDQFTGLAGIEWLRLQWGFQAHSISPQVARLPLGPSPRVAPAQSGRPTTGARRRGHLLLSRRYPDGFWGLSGT